ncbi:hypothetical protein HDU91_001652 [Kappamyces sp. JEL0680]|nr:hypothetical protein HDU91_001652 [Kappamyces sp. JEL0680]
MTHRIINASNAVDFPDPVVHLQAAEPVLASPASRTARRHREKRSLSHSLHPEFAFSQKLELEKEASFGSDQNFPISTEFPRSKVGVSYTVSTLEQDAANVKILMEKDSMEEFLKAAMTMPLSPVSDTAHAFPSSDSTKPVAISSTVQKLVQILKGINNSDDMRIPAIVEPERINLE